jgi:metallophosphoesterase (TIGR03767 family)
MSKFGGAARRVRGTLGRRQFLRLAGLLGLGVVVSTACREDDEPALTTLDETIVRGEDGTLLPAPGEPYLVRTDLAEALAGRESRGRSLIVFHQFSDFRIVDEESPLRSEWVDACEPAIATGAFRPQESLSMQAGSALVTQANRVSKSPVTGREVDFALHTGNAADNAQFNEIRWFIDLLDGVQVSPDSGASGYEGVQDASPADAYGELLTEAQSPFVPESLRYPWFAVAGNRDVLAQGTFPPNDQAQVFAVGSVKVMSVSDEVLQEACSDPANLLGAEGSRSVLNSSETELRRVGADEKRRLLSRKEWVEEHFNTAAAPGPVGHGMSEENRQAGTAYYSQEIGPVALIVLDSTNPGGFSAGSIDAAQFAWLEGKLQAYSRRYVDRDGKEIVTGATDRLIIIASHHTSAAMNNPFPDPETQIERFRGPQLEELLHRFPNVVLHVAGHGLEHRLTPKPDALGTSGGYWEVSTGSPLDFPMQSRLLELVDNGDGTISLFATVYDTAAPINPGDASDPTPNDGVNQMLLAGVARQVGTRDPQLDAAAPGLSASDRNAELLLQAPFELAPPSPAARQFYRRAVLGLR